jgi:intraflagellar transport protein 172
MTGFFSQAERYYIKCGMPVEAVDMYSRAGKWDTAQKVARGYLSDTEMHEFYRRKGREFEAERKFKDAEKAYLQVCGTLGALVGTGILIISCVRLQGCRVPHGSV